jgi:PAS domain S-box-containing protein
MLILDMLKDFVPDVAVLDVYMPDASGPELAAILRERDEQLHLPILFLSSETDVTQQLQALSLGGDDFLVKPVQPEYLVDIVTARARRARQSSAIRQRLEATLYEREREHLALNQHAIVSVADRAGNITYVNEKFCEISGYSQNELMGHNHRLIKSDVHPTEFYQNLWRTITGGRVWQGEVCNRRKDGSLYWVASTSRRSSMKKVMEYPTNMCRSAPTLPI